MIVCSFNPVVCCRVELIEAFFLVHSRSPTQFDCHNGERGSSGQEEAHVAHCQEQGKTTKQPLLAGLAAPAATAIEFNFVLTYWFDRFAYICKCSSSPREFFDVLRPKNDDRSLSDRTSDCTAQTSSFMRAFRVVLCVGWPTDSCSIYYFTITPSCHTLTSNGGWCWMKGPPL